MRYFFDIVSFTGGQATIDQEGCDLDTESEMRKEAIRLLAQVASDEAPYGNSPAISTLVRDNNGPVYRAVLTVEGQTLQ